VSCAFRAPLTAGMATNDWLELNWLLAGFVVTMKVYCVMAMWLHLVRKNSVKAVIDGSKEWMNW
jgi:hypothetical protein